MIRISIKKLKFIGYGASGILLFLGFILFSFLLISIFLKGGLWLSIILYPWLVKISLITFITSILILLPLSIFKKTRAISGTGFIIASFIFGATTWIWSFLLTYMFWGFWGLIIGLCVAGIGVTPIAMLAALLNGEWAVLWQLVLLIIFTLGFGFFAIYIKSIDKKARKDRIDE